MWTFAEMVRIYQWAATTHDTPTSPTFFNPFLKYRPPETKTNAGDVSKNIDVDTEFSMERCPRLAKLLRNLFVAALTKESYCVTTVQGLLELALALGDMDFVWYICGLLKQKRHFYKRSFNPQFLLNKVGVVKRGNACCVRCGVCDDETVDFLKKALRVCRFCDNTKLELGYLLTGSFPRRLQYSSCRRSPPTIVKVLEDNGNALTPQSRTISPTQQPGGERARPDASKSVRFDMHDAAHVPLAGRLPAGLDSRHGATPNGTDCVPAVMNETAKTAPPTCTATTHSGVTAADCVPAVMNETAPKTAVTQADLKSRPPYKDHEADIYFSPDEVSRAMMVCCILLLSE
jgi:hypothetical protein